MRKCWEVKAHFCKTTIFQSCSAGNGGLTPSSRQLYCRGSFYPDAVYYRVPEHQVDYLAEYPLGLQADDTGLEHIVLDRHGFWLGESKDLEVIEEMFKGENEAFEVTKHRKTYRELIAMFAS
jgi:hypothetical protein